MAEQNNTSLYFEGGSGAVEVSTGTDKKSTYVDLETREWEYQVREFARKIK